MQSVGATPDGIVGNNTIVEVKCPSSAFNVAPDAAILAGKISFWKPNGDGGFSINRKHSWFYQVQGQLNVTGLDTCIFGVWTGDEFNMKVEIIKRDQEFWKCEMEPHLIRFYLDCVLPELVDPRHTRNMSIRDPPSILNKMGSRKKLIF